MTNPVDLRERVFSGLESLRGLGHVPGEYLSFRVALLHGQFEIFDSLPPAPAKIKLPVQAESLKVAPAELSRFYSKTAEALKEASHGRLELEKLAADADKLVGLVEGSPTGADPEVLKKISSALGVSEDGLLFFSRAAAAPYVSRLVWTAEESAAASAESGECPYCGAGPGLSILVGETGTRSLACSLCGKVREFPRMKCPFCGADGGSEIVRESEKTPRWIECCGNCRLYLKTSDQRLLKQAEMLPLLEAVSSLYLDFIAEQQGCLAGLPYTAMR
jgi:formate dehydrogenase maturation protein FdhE